MSSYDQNLLGEAPKATRAQLQEGYNVDLLAEQPSRRTSVRNPPPSQTPQPSATPVVVPLTAVVAGTVSAEKFGSPVHPSTTPKPTFWRTRNIITLVLIAVIIVGAVVGGAVGGTLKKSKSTVKTTGTTGVTSSASPGATQPFATGTPAHAGSASSKAASTTLTAFQNSGTMGLK